MSDFPWQFLSGRHSCSADQNWDNWNLAFEGCLNFQANKVGGIVEPPLAPTIGGVHPSYPNQSDQNIAGSDALVDYIHKVLAHRNGIDIHEDLPFAEVPDQVVIKASGIAAAILTPITNEDS